MHIRCFPSPLRSGTVKRRKCWEVSVSSRPPPFYPPRFSEEEQKEEERQRSSGTRGTPPGAGGEGSGGESSPHKCFTFFPDSLTATKEPSASGKASDKVFADQPGYQKNAVEWQASGKTRGGVADIQGWGRREGGRRRSRRRLGDVSACSSPDRPSEGAVGFELADPRGAEGAACQGERKINK